MENAAKARAANAKTKAPLAAEMSLEFQPRRKSFARPPIKRSSRKEETAET